MSSFQQFTLNLNFLNATFPTFLSFFRLRIGIHRGDSESRKEFKCVASKELSPINCMTSALAGDRLPVKESVKINLSKLKILRQKIATKKVFSKAFEYFFDHFGEDPKFFDVGESVKDDRLIEMLGQIGGETFQTELVALVNIRLVKIKEYRFIHGSMTMNGAVANVIYCDDIQKGILVVYRPTEIPHTRFARFSAEMIAPNLAAQAKEFKH